ncbi:hypothetical protein [Mycolicibacterium sarraceniae]|uniref:Uncharacterized protein n=1 Tax=Mycolicibacterium sarraceniae TaxID=1534348 RepID=A0A7I7SVX2_9MYCO|nr:hypothetical protein [Mycolicibacterium sarraceniae]BBY61162.1 hypothetical protein MSAR_42980 [Mycolicibacterium sarraceniae]
MTISEDVAALLDNGSAAIPAAIAQVTVMAKAYTRGNGFEGGEPNDEIAAVITTAAARLAANGAQLPTDETTGPFTKSIRGSFTGWTLAEQAVLNRYRKRAM